MAKLDVKITEMKDFEIKTVEFGGAVYNRVGDEAQTGDLLMATADVSDTSKGSFYLVGAEGPFGGRSFEDDVDDLCGPQYTPHVAFRKEVKPEPSMKFNVGDRVNIVDLGGYILSADQRSGVIVNETRSFFEIEIDNYGGTLAFYPEELEPESAQIEVGDLARVKRYQSGHHVGQIVEVVEAYDGALKTKGTKNGELVQYLASLDAVELVAKAADRKDK